jgi:hypothetical protein
METSSSRSYITLGIIGIIVLGLVVAIFVRNMPKSGGEPASGATVALAQCLAEKGVTMYGAAWCPHCQQQKKEFGDAFKTVPYVECPDSPQICLDKKVESYPTWIFPDGTRLVGEQSLQAIAQKAQCSYGDTTPSATSTPTDASSTPAAEE